MHHYLLRKIPILYIIYSEYIEAYYRLKSGLIYVTMITNTHSIEKMKVFFWPLMHIN